MATASATAFSASAAPTNFLSRFGFTPEREVALSALLATMGGFIAGGAALYWYLDEVSPVDQDLDIWIPSLTKRNPSYDSMVAGSDIDIPAFPDKAEDCFKNDRMNRGAIEKFLGEMGYFRNDNCCGKRWCSERDKKPTDIPYHKNPEFQNVVRRIIDFRSTKTGGRKIQVIMYYCESDPLHGFDLDVCRISARPVDGGFRLELPADLTDTAVRTRQMRITNFSYPPNLLQRLKKYYERGFTVVTVGGRILTLEEALSLVV